VLRDKLTVLHQIAVFFYRKERKGFASFAKLLLCGKKTPLCGEKLQHDGKKSSYFVTIPMVTPIVETWHAASPPRRDIGTQWRRRNGEDAMEETRHATSLQTAGGPDSRVMSHILRLRRL
jgi:hypothetical protein